MFQKNEPTGPSPRRAGQRDDQVSAPRSIGSPISRDRNRWNRWQGRWDRNGWNARRLLVLAARGLRCRLWHLLGRRDRGRRDDRRSARCRARSDTGISGAAIRLPMMVSARPNLVHHARTLAAGGAGVAAGSSRGCDHWRRRRNRRGGASRSARGGTAIAAGLRAVSCMQAIEQSSPSVATRITTRPWRGHTITASNMAGGHNRPRCGGDVPAQGGRHEQ